MKKLKTLILFACGGCVAIMGCQSAGAPKSEAPKEDSFAQEIKEVDAGVYELQAGESILTVTEEHSGRITSYRLGEYELLTDSTINPTYFGSTLWVGPQKNWWGKIQHLDKLSLPGEVRGGSLELEGPSENLVGLQVKKNFRVEEKNNAIAITYTLKNVTDSVIWAGPWEVTRVPVGGLTFFPTGEQEPLEVSNLSNVENRGEVTWFQYDASKIQDNQKILTFGKKGWIAHVDKDNLFIKSFEDLKPDEVAPGQGEIEVFANKEKTYIEIENHGNYRELSPKDSLSYTVRWKLMKLPANMKVAPGEQQLIDFVESSVPKSM